MFNVKVMEFNMEIMTLNLNYDSESFNMELGTVNFTSNPKLKSYNA